jgi:hypothetical protein
MARKTRYGSTGDRDARPRAGGRARSGRRGGRGAARLGQYVTVGAHSRRKGVSDRNGEGAVFTFGPAANVDSNRWETEAQNCGKNRFRAEGDRGADRPGSNDPIVGSTAS